MKITNIDCNLYSSKYGNGKVLGQPLGVKSISIIKIETDQNIIGISEAYVGIYVPELVKKIIQQISEFLINKDVNTILENEIIQIPFLSRNGVYKSLLGAIEIALLDCTSKFKNIPLWKIFSETPNKNLNYYFSGGSAAFTPLEIENEINNLDPVFKGYKMRIGYQNWENDIKRIDKAKSLIDNKSLMLDAIMGSITPSWKFSDFKNKYDFLKSINPYWLEEPFHPNDLNSYIKASNLDIPIAFGEALVGELEFNIFLKSANLSYIQLDATHMGGFNIAKDIFGFNNSINAATHTWGSCISFMINLHLSYAFKQFKWVEVPGVEFAISKDMGLGGYYDILKNEKEIMEKTGLGIELDFDLLEKKYSFKKNSGFSL